MQRRSCARNFLFLVLPLASSIVLWSASASGQGTPNQTDAQQTSSPTDDQIRRKLETDKLKLETDKLKDEIDKLHIDRVTVWIAPAISAGSVLLLAVGLLVQRATTTRVQRMLGRVDLELKVAELVMSSRSSAMARERAEILTTLYEKGMSSEFLTTMRKVQEFPIDLGIELREEFLRQVGPKYDEPSDIEELYRRVFPGQARWLTPNFVPPKTAGARPSPPPP